MFFLHRHPEQFSWAKGEVHGNLWLVVLIDGAPVTSLEAAFQFQGKESSIRMGHWYELIMDRSNNFFRWDGTRKEVLPCLIAGTSNKCFPTWQRGDAVSWGVKAPIFAQAAGVGVYITQGDQRKGCWYNLRDPMPHASIGQCPYRYLSIPTLQGTRLMVERQHYVYIYIYKINQYIYIYNINK